MAKHDELSLEIMQYIYPMLYGHILFYEYLKTKVHKAITLSVLK
jgi:hypothetical protein